MKYTIVAEENKPIGKIKEGYYDFEVIESKENEDKLPDGQPNLKNHLRLTLRVHGPQGRDFKVITFFTPNMGWKIQNFWNCVGHPEKYKGENDASEFLNQKGRTLFSYAKSRDGKEYLDATFKTGKTPVKEKTAPVKDDDIPF